MVLLRLLSVLFDVFLLLEGREKKSTRFFSSLVEKQRTSFSYPTFSIFFEIFNPRSSHCFRTSNRRCHGRWFSLSISKKREEIGKKRAETDAFTHCRCAHPDDVIPSMISETVVVTETNRHSSLESTVMEVPNPVLTKT